MRRTLRPGLLLLAVCLAEIQGCVLDDRDVNGPDEQENGAGDDAGRGGNESAGGDSAGAKSGSPLSGGQAGSAGASDMEKGGHSAGKRGDASGGSGGVAGDGGEGGVGEGGTMASLGGSAGNEQGGNGGMSTSGSGGTAGTGGTSGNGGTGGKGGTGGTGGKGGSSGSAGTGGSGGSGSVVIGTTFPSPGSSCIALAWDGASLWYLDNIGRLFQLSTSGAVLRTIEEPAIPDTSDMLWDGQNLWALDVGYATGDLVRLDSNALELDRLGPVSTWAFSGIAWDGEYFWVGDYNSSIMHNYTAAGYEILNWGTSAFSHPGALTVGKAGLWYEAGDLYYESFYGELVQEIDLAALGLDGYGSCLEWDGTSLWYSSEFSVSRIDGGFTDAVGKIGATAPPPGVQTSFLSPGGICEGMAWDGTSLWYLDNLWRLFELSPSGEVLRTVESDDLRWKNDLASDGANGFWTLTDSSQAYVVHLNQQGIETSRIGPVDTWYGSALAWDGQYFVISDVNQNVIRLYDATGKQIRNWVAESFYDPRGMTTGEQGFWYVSDNELFNESLFGDLLDTVLLPEGVTPEGKCLEWDGTAMWYSSEFTISRLASP